MKYVLAALALATLVAIPAVAFGQEPLLMTPDGGVPLLEQLPPLLPGWVERLLSYAAVLGAALVAFANAMGHVLTRVRGAGGVVPAWLDVTVGVMLDLGTDLGALRARILGAPKT